MNNIDGRETDQTDGFIKRWFQTIRENLGGNTPGAEVTNRDKSAEAEIIRLYRKMKRAKAGPDLGEKHDLLHSYCFTHQTALPNLLKSKTLTANDTEKLLWIGGSGLSRSLQDNLYWLSFLQKAYAERDALDSQLAQSLEDWFNTSGPEVEKARRALIESQYTFNSQELAQELVASGAVESIDDEYLYLIFKKFSKEVYENMELIFNNLVGLGNPSMFINYVANGYSKRYLWDEKKVRLELITCAIGLLSDIERLEARNSLGMVRGKEVVLEKVGIQKQQISEFKSKLMQQNSEKQ